MTTAGNFARTSILCGHNWHYMALPLFHTKYLYSFYETMSMTLKKKHAIVTCQNSVDVRHINQFDGKAFQEL